jgi:hypothetical protein
MLMPYVFGRRGVNCIFGDVGGMVAHSFKAPANKYQVQVASQLAPILHHALD